MANPLRSAAGSLRSGVDPRSVAIGALLDAALDRVFGGGAPAAGSQETRAAASFRAGAADFDEEMARQELVEDRLHALAFIDDQALVDLGHHHHHHHPHHHKCGCGDC